MLNSEALVIRRTDWNIPMRPDHGHRIAEDFNRSAQPGYPLIGHLRGPAKLRDVIAALSAQTTTAGDRT